MIWVDAKEAPSSDAKSLLTRPVLLPPKLTAPAASPTPADIHAAAANAVDKAAVPGTSAAVPAAATAAASAAPPAAVLAAAAAAEVDAAQSAAHAFTLGGTHIGPVAAYASHHNNSVVQATAGSAAAGPATGAVHQALSTSSRESILPFQARALPISSMPKGRDGSALPFDAPALLTTNIATGRLDPPQGAQHGQLSHASAASGAPLKCHTQQGQQTEQGKQPEQARQAQQAQQAQQVEQAQQVDQLPRATARMEQQAILESSRHLMSVLGPDSPTSNEPSGNSPTNAQLDSQTNAAEVTGSPLPASQQKKRKAVDAAGEALELKCLLQKDHQP